MSEAPANLRTERVQAPAPQAVLAEIAELHRQVLPDGILSRLGGRFLLKYYTAIVESAHCVLWIVRVDQKLVGFLGGTTDRSGFEQHHRAGAAKSRVLTGILTGRIPLSAIRRTIRKRRLSRTMTERAELLTLGISPMCRRHGLGGKLLAEWHAHLRGVGISDYVVFTDNPEGLRFYEKKGGACLFRVEMGGEVSAAFRMAVTPEG